MSDEFDEYPPTSFNPERFATALGQHLTFHVNFEDGSPAMSTIWIYCPSFKNPVWLEVEPPAVRIMRHLDCTHIPDQVAVVDFADPDFWQSLIEKSVLAELVASAPGLPNTFIC